MPRYDRRRPRFARPRHPFHAAIWMIGLGVLFLWGHWWPGILVLIGLSMIVGAFSRPPAPRPFDEPFDENRRPYPPPPPPAPAPPTDYHRVDLLPATCPRCGAPVRAYEVKWSGSQAASCAYCGSKLPSK